MTTGYQPTSRRPIADALRKTADGAVRYCVAHDVHPDVVSYASVVAAAAAGLAYRFAGAASWLLLIAPAFLYLRLWCNMLDGMVALASGKASPRGEIVNELPDRVSDILIFVGVGYSGLASPAQGYWAALTAVFTAYVGLLGSAVGVQREFSGPMSKPWRMVTLHVGSWIAFAQYYRGRIPEIGAGLSTLDLTCLVVSVGCVVTCMIRLRRIGKALADKQASQSSSSSG